MARRALDIASAAAVPFARRRHDLRVAAGPDAFADLQPPGIGRRVAADPRHRHDLIREFDRRGMRQHPVEVGEDERRQRARLAPLGPADPALVGDQGRPGRERGQDRRPRGDGPVVECYPSSAASPADLADRWAGRVGQCGSALVEEVGELLDGAAGGFVTRDADPASGPRDLAPPLGSTVATARSATKNYVHFDHLTTKDQSTGMMGGDHRVHAQHDSASGALGTLPCFRRRRPPDRRRTLTVRELVRYVPGYKPTAV